MSRSPRPPAVGESESLRPRGSDARSPDPRWGSHLALWLLQAGVASLLVYGLVGYALVWNGYDPGLGRSIALVVVNAALLFRRFDRLVDAKLADR